MFSRLDIIGGIGGCLGGAGLAGIGYISGDPGTLEIGLAVLAASAVYLIFRKRMASSSDPSLPTNKPLTLIIHTIFFASFAASVCLMHSSLIRPLLYFLLTSICVATVAAGILSSSDKNQTWLLLLEIMLIAFGLRFGLVYELPGFYGVDPWWHSAIVDDWLRNGHIAHLTAHQYTEYADFPVMHLNIMATRIITSLDPKGSYYLSIGLFYVTSVVFVFLIGQNLINTRAGLFAALLTSTNMFHISWAALLVPASMGIGFFIALVWLIFKGTSNPLYTLILIVTSAALVFTHAIPALITAITLFFLFVANEVYRRLYKTGVEKMNIGLNLVVVFWVVMLGWWMYASYSPGLSLFEVLVTSFATTVRPGVEFVGGAFEPSVTPLGPLNRVGFLMFIGFIVIGALFWLWQQAINGKRVAIIIGILGLTIITFVLPFMNIGNLFTARWLPYLSVLAVVPAAEGIMALSRLLNGRIVKSVATVLVIFITSMFMLNSHAVNTLAPLYGRDYMEDPHRNAFLASELTAVETIIEIWDGQITADSRYKSLVFDTRIGPERVQYLDVEGENKGLIAIRKYIYTHPFVKGHDEEYNQLLASFSGSAYNTVYDNGEVKAFLEGPR